MSEDELRLYLVVRGDIEMPLGKALAQAGHAFVGVIEEASSMAYPELPAYLADSAQGKIAIKAKNLDALLRATSECQAVGLPVYVVRDAGRTVFAEPTITCAAIGPVRRGALPPFVRRFQLMGEGRRPHPEGEG